MHSNRVNLAVEQLEARELMAGNVFAAVEMVSKGKYDLVIRSDNPTANVSEFIRVRQVAAGQYSVEGWNNTSVNGAVLRRFSGVNNSIRIYTYGGNDGIHVLGTNFGKRLEVAGDLFIDSGSGNDGIAVKYVKAGDDIHINTKGGQDTTSLRGCIAGDDFTIEDTAAYQKGDRDVVFAEWCNAGYFSTGTFKINLSGGNDRVYLNHVTTDYLTANLGAGSDHFSMVNSYVAEMPKSAVDGGSGADTVNLYNNRRALPKAPWHTPADPKLHSVVKPVGRSSMPEFIPD